MGFVGSLNFLDRADVRFQAIKLFTYCWLPSSKTRFIQRYRSFSVRRLDNCMDLEGVRGPLNPGDLVFSSSHLTCFRTRHVDPEAYRCVSTGRLRKSSAAVHAGNGGDNGKPQAVMICFEFAGTVGSIKAVKKAR